MEFAKQEIEVISQTITEARQSDVSDLNELHLAAIAGGIGEVTFG